MISEIRIRQGRLLFITSTVLLITGCASLSTDGGMDDVSAMTQQRIGHTVQSRQPIKDDTDTAKQVRELLTKPLTPESATAIALRNNQGLQASLAELGVAEADLVQAGRLRNPGISFSRLRGADEIEIERGVMFDLTGLLTMPIRYGIEQRRFAQAKLQAAAQAVQLATDVRRAYFDAIAAQQRAHYLQQVQVSADAAAELAQRMAAVGNWSKLDQAREQLFYAEATAQLARARHNALAAREQLSRLLGLNSATQTFTLPERLPDLPNEPKDAAKLEATALEMRLDVLMATRNAEAMAKALGLSRATGFLNVLDLGYLNKSQTGQARHNGYEIGLELPLFDWGGARHAKAEAIYMQALHHTADTAVKARAEVRTAYSAYRTSYDLAKHYRDDILPLQKTISDEVLLRYNGMMIGVFELLADAREQAASVIAAIDAQRDFWLAETNLQAAIHGTGGDAAAMPELPVAQAQPHDEEE